MKLVKRLPSLVNCIYIFLELHILYRKRCVRQIYRTIKLYSLPPLLSYFYKSHKYPLNRYNNPFAIPLSSFVFGKGMRHHFLDKCV